MSIIMLPILSTELIKIKFHVYGFAFSHDFQKVYLKKKNKPEWQKGLLNGLGGLIREGEGEGLTGTMSREFHEQCGVLVDSESWIKIEFIGSIDALVFFYCARLPEGAIPYKTTDEELWSVYWKNYNQRQWEKLGVADNVPYLISKAYNMLKLISS